MADTLQSFLVDLGFKVDDASYKRFVGAVGGVTKSILQLGAEVVGTTAAVEQMVQAVARQMQDLYYAAQRSGVAVQALQAVGYAAKQLGLDSQQGMDLYEGFARAVRYNPGVQGLAASLGGQFKDVNGQIGLTQQGLKAILENLAKMPRFEAMMYAPLLGFNADTLNTILNNLPLFEQRMDATRKMAQDFGLNLKEAADRGTEFSQSVGTLGQKLEFLGERAFVDLEPSMERLIDDLSAGVTWFGKFSDSLGGLPAELAAIATSLGGVTAALRLLSAIPGFGWVFGGLGVPGLLATGAAATAYGVQKTNEQLAKEHAGFIMGPEGPIPMPEAGPVAQTPTTEPASGFFNRIGKWLAPNRYAAKPTALSTPIPTGTSREARAIGYFESQGLTPAQAIGMVGNLEGESGRTLNPLAENQGAFGIAQWRGARLAALKDFAKEHNSSASNFMTQLEFIAHELEGSESYAGTLLRHAQSPEQAAELASTYYERAPGGYAEAIRRGELAATITNHYNIAPNTNITVTGVNDPERAAGLVRRSQAGVVDDMTRLFAQRVR